ncbi:MAG: DSD1 family PLP-dependent enzyme [Dehalococcoidia bacterium]|nr:DSD1 family PLP-dependent enzyme [Dehalococcoidia bacterium]
MRPRTTADIPTPALLVDVPAMERNIRRMAAFFADGPCKLRPHFKAHKTPEIARRQLAAGSCSGLTCATVAEAEVAAELCDDILIANQVLGPGKAARVAALARRIDIKVAVDSLTGVEEIAAAARPAGVTVGVLVEVAAGFRCGVAPGEEAVALARRVAEAKGVALRGVMGYEGHAVGLEDRGEREAAARSAMERLLSSVRLVREASLPCAIVSAGGTGTYDITGRLEGITEIQAGSYVLMDTAYAKLGLPFEQALSVLGTVLSRPSAAMCVADCGHKSCTMDHGNPAVKGIAGASVVLLADEHALISLPPASGIKPGDRIELWPSHADPTINLHDMLYATEGETVIDMWPVTARGYAEQRAPGG